MLVAIVPVKGVHGATDARLAMAARAAELRAAGWLQREIAAELGIGRSYASELLRDPDGSKSRARKDSYAVPCPQCGTPMSGSEGRNAVPELCGDCMVARQHAERYWTKPKIIAAIWLFAARFGRPPAANDMTGRSPSQAVMFSDERNAEIKAIQNSGIVIPTPWIVAREFGSWNAAILAAGFETSRGGGPQHRGSPRQSKRAPRREQILALLAKRPHTLAELDAAANGASVKRTLTDLRKDGLIENTAARGPGRKALYQLTPQANRSNDMPPEPTLNDWIVIDAETNEEIGRVAAPTQIAAIERAVTKPGNYRAIRARDWKAYEVGVIARLTVMPKSG